MNDLPADDVKWDRGVKARVRSELASLRAECDALRDSAKRVDGQLSRILHEMAGAVSLCWIPKPSGEFDSSRAIEFVSAAIEELRALAAPRKEGTG